MKRAGELMIPLTDYPHIPYWFSLRQAIAMLSKSEIEVEGRKSLPRAFLVFNEAYELLGVVRRRDILRGLGPRALMEPISGGREKLFDVKADPALFEMSHEQLAKDIREQSERPVGEVMLPIKATLSHDDQLVKIMYEMVQSDLSLLPVMKDGGVVGVVRSVDVLEEIAKLVL